MQMRRPLRGFSHLLFFPVTLFVLMQTVAIQTTLRAEEEGTAPAEDLEDSEWKTMRSEGRGRSAPAIRIDETNQKIVTGKIGFQSNSEAPTPEAARILKQLAAFLAKKPEISVRIEGHADSVGSDQANLEKSERRANQVKEVLIQNGVAAERLQAVGMGDKYPVASDATADGQAKNRRVEFLIAGGEGQPPPSPPPAAPSLPPPTTATEPIPSPPLPPFVPVQPPPPAVTPPPAAPAMP